MSVRERERDRERRGLLKKKRLKIKPGMASGWSSAFDVEFREQLDACRAACWQLWLSEWCFSNMRPLQAIPERMTRDVWRPNTAGEVGTSFL